MFSVDVRVYSKNRCTVGDISLELIIDDSNRQWQRRLNYTLCSALTPDRLAGNSSGASGHDDGSSVLIRALSVLSLVLHLSGGKRLNERLS